MSVDIKFDPIRLPKICQDLREEVREFLRGEEAAGTFDHRETAMGGIFNTEFSKKVGARGWIGMSWPKQYGGHERTFLERYVVTEEMRVANAPVRGHFTADRQSGPMLLKFANEDIKRFEDITKLNVHESLTYLTYTKEKNEIEARNIKNKF